MPKNQFAHLHVHSDYSLLNGLCRVRDIASLAEKYHMPAVALTDHGVMGGVPEFIKYCSWDNIKPITGCGVCLSPASRFDTTNDQIFHLILLAKDYAGYQNLCRLVSAGQTEGFHNTPRIDKEMLAERSKGLICLSSCIKGEISQPILEGRMDDAEKLLNEYLDIFGRENFYLELTDHGLPIEEKANQGLIALGKEFNVKVVATNDVHYLHKEDASAHDLLRCIKNGTTVNDESRYTFAVDEYYFKTADEMAEIFKDTPEAISNTLAIAEQCNLTIPVSDYTNTRYWPKYEIKNGESGKGLIESLCNKAVANRYGFDLAAPKHTDEQKNIIKRLEYELKVIDESNFNDYFLMVQDIVRYAKNNNFPVGPGRGTVGGSIVCFLLGITDIDPIRYDLTFERFLNPERIIPPDIDLEFCEIRRKEIFDYIRGKYGNDKTADIAVYQEFRGKILIKAVTKALKRSAKEANKICRLLSPYPQASIQRSIEENPRLDELVKKESWARVICDAASKIQFLKKSWEIHAAGIIIADKKLTDIVPVFRGEDGKPVSQYTADDCEDMGLLRMDFLGLRALTVIQRTVDSVREKEDGFDIRNIPLDDENTLNLLSRGDTEHIFNLESESMQELCRNVQIDSIEDLIAAICLFRPGPMQCIPEFIARKKGKENISYIDSRMEPILKETHGMILYQEQIIELIHQLSGLSRGQGDLIRRAMGKKKISDIDKYHQAFIPGCMANGITESNAIEIWDNILKASGYCFNKSHATGYALLAYRMAYLKAHYREEFMEVNGYE